jgi:hypothetical protein
MLINQDKHIDPPYEAQYSLVCGLRQFEGQREEEVDVMTDSSGGGEIDWRTDFTFLLAGEGTGNLFH